MKLHRFYRFVMLAAASGFVFQAAASCSPDAVNSLTGTLSPALGLGLTGLLSQLIVCPV
jgi:hypothetical protein